MIRRQLFLGVLLTLVSEFSFAQKKNHILIESMSSKENLDMSFSSSDELAKILSKYSYKEEATSAIVSLDSGITLPNEFFELINIDRLQIIAKGTLEIDGRFKKLSRLTWLEITCDHLSSLDKSIKLLKNLEGVNIDVVKTYEPKLKRIIRHITRRSDSPEISIYLDGYTCWKREDECGCKEGK
jgi:hypothetical protein